MLFLFLLIGVIELSLPETLVIAVAASFVQSFWHARERPKLIHLSFNVASLVIATISTDFAYTAPTWFKPDLPIPARLAAAAATFFVGNTLTVAIIVGLTERKSVVETWRTYYFWSFPYYFGGACVAGSVYVPDSERGMAGVDFDPAGYLSRLSLVPYLFRPPRRRPRACGATGSGSEAFEFRSREYHGLRFCNFSRLSY